MVLLSPIGATSKRRAPGGVTIVAMAADTDEDENDEDKPKKKRVN